MTIIQVPNKRLLAALAGVLISNFSNGWLEAGSRAFFYMAIAIWAYAEITEGNGWFRRGLGLVVLIYFGFDLARRLMA